MLLTEINKLQPGLYRVEWNAYEKAVPISLAAVGIDVKGQRWLAPCDWIAPGITKSAVIWKLVKSVELIQLQN